MQSLKSWNTKPLIIKPVEQRSEVHKRSGRNHKYLCHFGVQTESKSSCFWVRDYQRDKGSFYTSRWVIWKDHGRGAPWFFKFPPVISIAANRWNRSRIIFGNSASQYICLQTGKRCTSEKDLGIIHWLPILVVKDAQKHAMLTRFAVRLVLYQQCSWKVHFIFFIWNSHRQQKEILQATSKANMDTPVDLLRQYHSPWSKLGLIL